MLLQVAYNQVTGAILIQNDADAVPGGYILLGKFDHTDGDDDLGFTENHVIYHHIRDLLYTVGVQSMQAVNIINSVGGSIIPPPTLNPSIIAPETGQVGITIFSAYDGTPNRGVIYSREWLLDGVVIGTGETITPQEQGELIRRVKAIGPGGNITVDSDSAIVGSAMGVRTLLTPADMGNAPWTGDKTILRYMPWVQINPIKPGITKKFDGSYVIEKISQTNRVLSGASTLDSNQDYKFVGKDSWEGGIPTAGSITINGGNSQAYYGVDSGGVKITTIGFKKSIYVEGGRGDFRAQPEGDFWFFGGLSTSDPRNPDLPDACFQNMASLGQHGTNRDHKRIPGDVTSGENSVALTSLVQTSPTEFTAVLASVPPGLTQPFAQFTASVIADENGKFTILNVTDLAAGHKVGAGMLLNFPGAISNQFIDATKGTNGQLSGTPGGIGTYALKYTQGSAVASRTMTARAWEFNIGGSQIAGIATLQGDGFNQAVDFVSYDVATRTLVVRLSSFAGPSPNQISGLSNTAATTAAGTVTGATLWIMNAVPGEHSDFLQQDGSRMCRSIEIHNITPEANYCGIIIVDDPRMEVSNFNYRINRAHAPMDNGSEFMRIGNEAQGAGLQLKRFFNCWAEVRPTNSLANMSPTTSNGAFITTIDDKETLLWTRDEFRGGIIRGIPPGGNFVNFADVSMAYTPNTAKYFGYAPATAANLTDITVSSTPVIPEGTSGGTTLCLVNVIHNLGRHPAEISLSVVASNVSLNQWFLEGRYLQTGRTQFDYETTPIIDGKHIATVTIRAQIVGTAHYIDRVFSFEIGDATTASGLTVTASKTDNIFNATPSATTAFNGFGVGTANTNRYVVAITTGWSNDPLRVFTATQSLIGATDGTKSMNRIIAKKSDVANGNYAQAALYIAELPSDTTANLSITTGSALTAIGIGVFSITGLSDRKPYSYNSASVDIVGGQLGMELDLPANGVAVLGAAYGTSVANNKRHTGCRFSSTIAATYMFRVTITPGSVGPATWEYSTDGTNWTVIPITGDTGFDQLIEGAGGSGTVIVGASFGPAT